MIRQDLNAGADDEDHEEPVEEMLQIHPRRETRRTRRGRCLDGPRVLPDEPLHGGLTAQTLGNRDRDDEQQEADRKQPEQVEPLLAPDANPGSDSIDLWDRARPSGGVDDILARRQLVSVTANDVRGDARLPTGRQIPTGGVALGPHEPRAYDTACYAAVASIRPE